MKLLKLASFYWNLEPSKASKANKGNIYDDDQLAWIIKHLYPFTKEKVDEIKDHFEEMIQACALY